MLLPSVWLPCLRTAQTQRMPFLPPSERSNDQEQKQRGLLYLPKATWNHQGLCLSVLAGLPPFKLLDGDSCVSAGLVYPSRPHEQSSQVSGNLSPIYTCLRSAVLSARQLQLGVRGGHCDLLACQSPGQLLLKYIAERRKPGLASHSVKLGAKELSYCQMRRKVIDEFHCIPSLLFQNVDIYLFLNRNGRGI